MSDSSTGNRESLTVDEKATHAKKEWKAPVLELLASDETTATSVPTSGPDFGVYATS